MDSASAPASQSGDHQSPVAARFDLWAAGYDTSVLQDAFYARLHHHVLHLAARIKPSPRRVLDLGCGTGRLLYAAAARFPHAELLGADISAGMLEHAQARARAAAPIRLGDRRAGHREVAFLQADAAHLPLITAAFDVVTCTASSHHWPDPQPALAELRRVTAPEGLLILAHVPGVAAWDRRSGTSRLTVLLGDAGFRISKAALYAECPVMPTTVVLCARPDTLPRRRSGLIRRLRPGDGAAV
ncbi:MAG: class I SAM-dependent methyltransferase [Catenulispora sp.]